MSDDDFLDGLRSDWQSDAADLAGARALVEAGAARLRAERRARIVHALVLGALAIFFGWSAWALKSVLFQLGAAAFLAAVLMTLADLLYLRGAAAQDLLQTTGSVLDQAERQARTALRLTEAMMGSAVLLSVCAIIALLYGLSGEVDMLRAGLLTGVWLFAAGFSLIRQRQRRAQALAELAQVQAMRAELAEVA